MSAEDRAALRALEGRVPRDEEWPRRSIDTEGTCDGCGFTAALVAAYDGPSGENEPWLCRECADLTDLDYAMRNALPALLDAADERDRLVAGIEALANHYRSVGYIASAPTLVDALDALLPTRQQEAGR